MDLVLPQVVARAIDEGIVEKDPEALRGFALLAASLILLRGATLFLSRLGTRFYESKIERTLRNQLYDKLQKLPFGYYDRVDSGDVITVAISDSTTVKGFAGSALMELVRTAGIFVVIVIGMILTSVQLTLLSLIVLALMIAAATIYSRVVRPMWLAYRRQQARVTQTLTENLNGIRVVKAFAMENREIEAFRLEAEAMRQRAMAPIRLRARLVPLLLLFTGVGTLVVVWAGGLLAIDGTISVGVLVAFYYYFTRLLRPSRMVAFLVQRVTRAAVSAERLFGLLDEPVPIASPEISLECGQEKLGIVGESGSGKSSLLNLIPRYYDSTAGEIRLDNRPIQDFNLQGLRSQVAIVPQDPFLFSDSIHNNIAYGEPSAGVPDIVAAARSAQAYEFITAMPEGFETVVGERGVGLSGGQRQRLTIARALLLDSPILILDDATSSVDTQTERKIQEALQERSTGRTTFIISQRISSVEHADTILVIDRGRVLDRGTHHELLTRPGFYRDLFDLQASRMEEARTDLSAASPTSP